MRHKNHRISFLLLFILPAFGCQLLDRLVPSQSEQEVVVLPTLTPEGEASAVPSDSAEPSAQEAADLEASLVPSVEDEAGAPPPLPATIPSKSGTDDGEEISFTLFESPAGYRFQHPASWNVSDFFGQTIATNDPAVLEMGTLRGDQILVLLIAGPVEDGEQSAEQLLNTVQQDVLADYLAEGTLTPRSAVEPLTQGGGTGVQATYQLVANNGENLLVRATSLIKQDLYVVTLTLQPDSDQTDVGANLQQFLESLELTADQYLVDAAAYGLTQEELDALEQELIDSE